MGLSVPTLNAPFFVPDFGDTSPAEGMAQQALSLLVQKVLTKGAHLRVNPSLKNDTLSQIAIIQDTLTEQTQSPLRRIKGRRPPNDTMVRVQEIPGQIEI